MNFYYWLTELYWSFKYTNEHLKGNNRSYQKFILLTYKRSGSNYLLDLLRSHQQIVSYGGLYGKGVIFPYKGYPPGNRKSIIRYRNKYPVEFLNKRIYGSFNDKVKAVGFKISYASRHQAVIEYLKTLPDLKVINLQRSNLLHMYLSAMISSVTKKSQAMCKEDENFAKDCGVISKVKIIDKADDNVLPDDFKIELKYEECLKEFENISSHVKRFNDFFKPEQMLTVCYDNLLADSEHEARRAMDFLGVEHQPLRSRFVKINRKKPSEVISNYHELKEKFAGTVWAVFFEE
ncbi:MAG: sulfotransferase domain-containing protein [Bacteroidota bacterium]